MPSALVQDHPLAPSFKNSGVRKKKSKFRGYEDFALGHENTKFSELIKNFKNRFRKRPGPSDPRALRDVFMLMAVNQTAENQAKLMRHL